MIDLPNQAVMLGGLEHWRGVDRQIFEERLAAKVQKLVGVWLFPLWFVAQYEDTRDEDKRAKGVRSRPLVHYHGLIKGKYVGLDRKSYPDRTDPVRAGVHARPYQ